MKLTQKHCLAFFLIGLCVILLAYPVADYLAQVLTYGKPVEADLKSELIATFRALGAVTALVFGYGLIRIPPQEQQDMNQDKDLDKDLDTEGNDTK